MPLTEENIRSNASRIHAHGLGGSSKSNGCGNSHSSLLELTRSPCNVVRDPRYGVCLVWRPVEGPPLPRCIPRAHEVREGDAKAAGYTDEPFAPAAVRRDASTSTTETVSRPRSTSLQTQYPSKENQARHSPPRGQLFHRGKGGIDDVLRNAREADRLFSTLQAQRLQAEYRCAQASLRQELDQQRRYKRMVELAEYQAELVNIFGHTMRDIVADSFFDDGSDPVLAALQRKRDELPSTHSALYAARHRGHWSGTASLGVGAHRGSADGALVSTVLTRESGVTQERRMLQRALEEVRGGRRRGY
ncbi:hypothetical protein LtaPh_3301400 [Leishmania tarentolae]|uniref:Uncharacterized protein n=1 Tax=Leishmania tarentolae TaxID=5689 RepID=A0A640KPS7_LEITA|nr:hypothetical protein LtaPh_3301400 [Leishmania tarentolae]